MSLDDISEQRIRQHVMTLQIINGALGVGLVAYLVTILVLRGVPVRGADLGLLTYISVGFFLLALVAALIIPRVIVQREIGHIARGTWKPPANTPTEIDFSAESAKTTAVHEKQTIVRLAILEGAGFLSVTAYHLEGHWIALGVALVALGLLLYQFPTRSRIESWSDRQRGQIQALRQWARDS